jgi:CO/xanthine dehydrogenase Mo-binding subunit
MDEVPRVDVKLIDRPDERSLGVGEGAQGPAVAAIANAVASATAKRLRDLPFTKERVKAQLSG